MKKAIWYKCTNSKRSWQNGEYLIEKAPKNGIVIWFNRQAGVTHIKTLDRAISILKSEFDSVIKINR